MRAFNFGGYQGSRKFLGVAGIGAVALLSLQAGVVQAGPRGSEFDLTLTPAAGGMEGVGVVRPQDPVAMIFGNPSTLTQLQGSNAFTLGASYISPDLRARNSTSNPNPFAAPGASGTSRLDNAAVPHAVALHRVSPDLVLGGGFTGISGLGSDFRKGTTTRLGFPDLVSDLKLFGGNMVASYKVTPQMSVGGAFTVGIGALQAGLVQNTAAVNGFGVGGSVGATYDLGPLMIGGTYKSELDIRYNRAIETSPGVFSALTLQQPQDFTFGVASTDLVWKDTLVEANYRFKNWDNATGYRDFWKDQHVVSLGAQHAFSTPIGRVTARAGYSYGSKLAKNARDLGNSFAGVTTVNVPGSGVVPVSPAFIQAAQATITDGYWRQSVSFGLGYQVTRDLRLDVNTSYAFDGQTNIGAFSVNGRIFTAGMGFTWTFK